ncbi:hypothetical protein LCGC14_2886610, partial [marine sediment metagenome]
MSRLAEIDEREKAATKGPWKLFDKNKTRSVYKGDISP